MLLTSATVQRRRSLIQERQQGLSSLLEAARTVAGRARAAKEQQDKQGEARPPRGKGLDPNPNSDSAGAALAPSALSCPPSSLSMQSLRTSSVSSVSFCSSLPRALQVSTVRL